MVRVLAKNPGMSFEQAREEVQRLLGKAAGRRVYGIPRVLSAEQQEREKGRLRAAFSRPGEQRRTVQLGVSSVRGQNNLAELRGGSEK